MFLNILIKSIYKKILETFPDAELIDVEIEEKNND